jgi:hypothetical protein
MNQQSPSNPILPQEVRDAMGRALAWALMEERHELQRLGPAPNAEAIPGRYDEPRGAAPWLIMGHCRKSGLARSD